MDAKPPVVTLKFLKKVWNLYSILREILRKSLLNSIWTLIQKSGCKSEPDSISSRTRIWTELKQNTPAKRCLSTDFKTDAVMKQDDTIEIFPAPIPFCLLPTDGQNYENNRCRLELCIRVQN
ncbi:unnamed protein product [Caenorhabditis nigoni]